MSKIFFGAYPYPSQTVTAASIARPTDQITFVHGFDDFHLKRESVRPRIVREILHGLLTHDVIAITPHVIGDLEQAFGIEPTLRMLQRGCFEVLDDNGLTPILKQISPQRYSVESFSDGKIDDKDGALGRLEKNLIRKSFDRKVVDAVMVNVRARRTIVDSVETWTLLQKEITHDLQNVNLTTSQFISARAPDEIPPVDGLKILRLLHLNKALLLANGCGANAIATDAAMKTVIASKLSPVIARTARQPLDVFTSIMAQKGLPDLSRLYLDGLISIDEFLDLRERRDGKKFRDWFAETGYDPTVVQRELLAKKVEQSALTKHLRFIIPNAIGFTNNAAGLVASAVDSYIIEKFVGGWHPNIFLDDVLKQDIDSRIRAQELAVRRADIKKRFPGIERNDLCPRRSGKKFKKCCGAAL